MRTECVLLFTDIEGSTQLAEDLGDSAASKLWAEHDLIARRLLRVWRGREIDKSDGFLLLFEAVADAVGFAQEMHRAFKTLQPPLFARAGIHWSSMEIRENAPADVAQGAKALELDGIGKAVASRIMAVARGGQTLLSSAAREAIGSVHCNLQSHGHWRMKGIAEPLELFEASDAGTLFGPPPDSTKSYRVLRSDDGWLPVAELRHGLPAERDSFVGRAGALAGLAERIDGGARLVTVLGMGGIGKTRLAVRYARCWLGDYPGGAWFCDLASAHGLDGLVHAIAQGLDVPLGKADPVQQLGAAIAGRGQCLVILDNFEQVAHHAEATVGRWLERAPQATLLVTSRDVLGIAGEAVFALAPLAIAEAVQLFERRACAADNHYAPTPAEQRAVPTLVNLLERLPLAIGLAAARVRVMVPSAMVTRMGERFMLLASTGNRRDRQATLRATFDWSWELLSAPEKAALAQLAAFEAGFALAAAEVVIDLSEFGAGLWSVDVLQSLVQKSLVRQLHHGRFDLLRSVQEYASEKLKTLGAKTLVAAAAVHQRHWSFFARFEHAPAAECLVELDNLVVACRRALHGADAEAAVACLMGAWQALKMAGPFRATLELLNEFEPIGPLLPAQRLRWLWVAGRVHHLLGNQETARRYLDEGLALCEGHGDAGIAARLLCASGEQWTTAGNPKAAADHLERARQAAQQAASGALMRDVQNSLGALAAYQGRMPDARGCYEAALSLCTDAADADSRGGLLGNLGEVDMSLGHRQAAREHFEHALALVSSAGHRRWEGNTRCNLGLLHHEEGRVQEAGDEFDAALQIARQIGYTRLEATVLCNLGIQRAASGLIEDALDCHEQAVALAESLGDIRAEGQFRTYLGQVLTRIGRLAEADACLMRGETLLRSSDDPISLGLLLCERAHLDAARSLPDRAADAFAQARRLADSVAAPARSELGMALRRLANGATRLAAP